MRSPADQADTPAQSGRFQFTRKRSGPLCFLAPLLTVLILLVLITESLALNSRTLSSEKVQQGFLVYGSSVASKVMQELRIHRAILAIVAGASFAVVGVIIRALTHNPLAEPNILGVNMGASLVVAATIGGLGLISVNQCPPLAFTGATTAAVLVHVMAWRSANAGPARLVLAGVVLGASSSSIIGTMIIHNSKAFNSY